MNKGGVNGLGGTVVSHRGLLLALSLLLVLVMLVAIQISAATNIEKISPGVLITFLTNGIFGCSMIVKETLRTSVSLKQVHWIFFLTFLVVAPLNQYMFNYAPWNFVISTQLFISTNLIIFVWGVLFCGLSSIGLHEKTKTQIGDGYRDFFDRLPKVSRLAVIGCFAASLLSFVAFATLVGFENAFSRSTAIFETDAQSSGLLLSIFVRATPVFSFAFIFVHYRQYRNMKTLLVLSFIILIIVDFPTGMPRYNAAAIYGGLMILLIPAFLNQRGLFPLVFLGALIFVFPAINAFRLSAFSPDGLFFAFSNVITSLPEAFLSGDYDAYSMLARAISYVEKVGISGGYQLLGSLFFFIPRSVWVTKPYGSGATIALAEGQAFTNLSCPLPAEGFINFGFPGLVVFVVALAIFCRFFDRRSRTSSEGWILFWPFLCFFLFFVLRGDLMSGLAYTSGYFFVFALELLFVRHVAFANRHGEKRSLRDSNTIINYQNIVYRSEYLQMDLPPT